MEKVVKHNWNIQFIKPCRGVNEKHRQLTPEYVAVANSNGKVVQINLDNCSIQRMEKLSENSTLSDVQDVGLLPLVDILNSGGVVSLSAIGVHEMPDLYIKNAKIAYQIFCKRFWPQHKNDIEATDIKYDENCIESKVNFQKLPNGARIMYGSSYVSMLQIQNIALNYSNVAPEEQFEIYMHSIIGMLNIVNAFELEIAKYAFWKPIQKQINQLPISVRERRKDIKENFTKTKRSVKKCKEFAFDAAMDIQWLSSANLSEDLNSQIDIHGTKFSIDNWVGTNDHKLYRISRDIHSTYHDGSTMKHLAYVREHELYDFYYWRNVDYFSRNIMSYRKSVGYSDLMDLLQRIDKSVENIEKEIINANGS